MKSENINELALALSKVQSQITGAVKNAKNPHFKSDFANLESCWDAIREPLAENGLAIIQTTDVVNGDFVLVTTLVHSSGQWVSGHYVLEPTKRDPQGLGGAVTYARRYALAAIVGLYQVDDDGNAASTKTEEQRAERDEGKAPLATSKTATKDLRNTSPEDFEIPFGEKGRILKKYSKDELTEMGMKLQELVDSGKGKAMHTETLKNIDLVLKGRP
jgi:hypothetical protein